MGGRASTSSQIGICGLILWSIFVVILAYPNLWVDYLVWVNSLVDFYGLICLVWIDFCVVGVVLVMGWGMFEGISINLGLNLFFSFGTEYGFVVCSSNLFSLKFMSNEKP